MAGASDPQAQTAPDPVAIAQALIRCPSVTPADEGALAVVEQALAPFGFTATRLPFSEPGHDDVDNSFVRVGSGGPHFCFAGHTDVVPPGDPASWSVDPFAAEVRDGVLIGRGACDMKGSIAAFVAAAGGFVAEHGADFGGSISLLITGDEEGVSVNGTKKMLAWLDEHGQIPDACLVGEPSCPDQLGDTIKIGRRGNLTAELTVQGVQGHTAYPAQADNAASRIALMLAGLVDAPLDEGTEHFVPSNLEITTIDVGNPAGNVIPAKAFARFNARFNTHWTGDSLSAWIRERLERVGGRYDLSIRVGGDCFLTEPGPLSELVGEAVEAVTGVTPDLNTKGGTSDARFIKDYCPVVEFGLVNRTIHKVDEQAPVADIEALTRVYRAVLDRYFADTLSG
jgi:succinyl-diaminopimelate desuccinylase